MPPMRSGHAHAEAVSCGAPQGVRASEPAGTRPSVGRGAEADPAESEVPDPAVEPAAPTGADAAQPTGPAARLRSRCSVRPGDDLGDVRVSVRPAPGADTPAP